MLAHATAIRHALAACVEALRRPAFVKLSIPALKTGRTAASAIVLALLHGPTLAEQPPVTAADIERVLFTDGFDRGLDGWDVLDPATWIVSPAGNGPAGKPASDSTSDGSADRAVEITERESAYRPPHRSPKHVALAPTPALGPVALTVSVKQLRDTGSHRDCCVFFGWQDAAHFYYVHLGAEPDPHSGQIMVVDGADRVALTDNTRRVPWTDGWHTVRVERDPRDGAIRVYFEDLTTPLMAASDKRFATGRVGIGSFDDLCRFDDVRVERLE